MQINSSEGTGSVLSIVTTIAVLGAPLEKGTALSQAPEWICNSS